MSEQHEQEQQRSTTPTAPVTSRNTVSAQRLKALKLKKPTGNNVRTDAVYKMSSTSSISNVRASIPLAQMSMKRHYRAVYFKPPELTTSIADEETIEAHKNKLSRTDAQDAYGARVTKVIRSEFEAITVFR